MKWCVDFPEESVLMVRPSLDALCYSVKPAAKLLGVLLYRYSIRQEHQQDAENMNEVATAQGKEGAQDTSFSIYRRQAQLVADMVNEITEKTLHDVAIPTLQLLGYLDVDETPSIHKYDLHVNIVREALAAYKKSPVELSAFLLGHLQLEKFLIDEQLEEVLINKKKFSLALEKVLIVNRNISNNKRGRKTRQERALLAISEDPQINIEIDSKIGNREEGTYGADAPTPAHLKEIVDEELEKVDRVQRRITGEHPAVKPANETQYHIANSSAIGNEERVIVPALSLPSKGVSTHEPTSALFSVRAALSDPGGNLDMVERTTQGSARDPYRIEDTGGYPTKGSPSGFVGADSEQAPGAGTQAINRSQQAPGMNHQATPVSVAPTPAQADFPPAGSVAAAPTAQASGASVHKTKAVAIPERPKNVKKLPVMPEPPKTVTLTPQEAAFWALWCGVFFNKDIAPHLTVTAYGHIKQLAPHITSAEQMESLVKKARQDLEGNTGVKRKTVYLGNCVNSYPGWKQEQQAQGPPEEKPPMDKYTAASRDKERLERGLQRLRDLTIAEGRGGELPK